MRIAIATSDRVRAEALRRAVGVESGHELAWIARDADAAEAMCRSDCPALLLLDPELAPAGGIPVTRRILAVAPCAILLVTGREAPVDRVYDALGHGALDHVAAPTVNLDGELAGLGPFLSRLATVLRLAPPDLSPPEVGESAANLSAPLAAVPLVAIGASTGGPAALATVLGRLPPDLDAALVIVQHIDDGFADGLASWLSELTRFPVEPVRSSTAPQAGRGYLAAIGEHLVWTADRRLDHTPHPAQALHRPAIDVLFASLVAYPSPGLAILLTGMGRDGADGLLKLRRAGWATVAQDARSSVVYGMPRAAAEIGAAEQVLPLEAIASTIIGFAAKATLRR
jgi:two-component system response regulator WspF